MTPEPVSNARTLTRRRLLALGGGAAALAIAGCTPETPSSGARPDPAPSPAAKPVLRFTIGLHIEPFGTTAQGFRSGAVEGRQLDYADRTFFERQSEDIRAVAAIVEQHSGRMTVQAQSPFTSAVIARGSSILRELAAAGHEIALHFHEDAHLGPSSASLPVGRWTAVLEEELDLLRRASGVDRIRSWSGGNLYPRVYEAAAAAGLEVNSDWKNPASQSTPLELTGVNPWRPAGGTDGTGFSAFSRHDPAGPVIFLPEGAYDREDFASARRGGQFGGDEAYFAYLGERLRASLAASRADRVNVYHFTIHPGEFRGSAAAPFAVIDRFLAESVGPLVAAGDVTWATFSAMADAFIAWERANPGTAPK
ncbi:hypothetical protein [Tepidiforma sp.]|uniref:hypothetical protein n=1 Tax=Tepidiforma sp. TaxID=2682230 RepID=UPI002605DE20|nr:hypothetical protein [Tepidiforma sp.]MCX7617954.1 hypothetical protein [Tepidiforma sp.]